MKSFKRNAVIITVLLFVCVAAYLNWSYNSGSEDSETAAELGPQETASSISSEDADPSVSDAGLYYSSDTAVNQEYFDSARLNRQQAKDAAAATLADVSKTEGASEEMVDAALASISKLADDTVKEAEVEDIIKAKGFADCVVYLSESGVSVTVPAPAEGLPAAAVAKITDVITTQTDFKAADLKIIEVK